MPDHSVVTVIKLQCNRSNRSFLLHFDEEEKIIWWELGSWFLDVGIKLKSGGR